MFKLIHYSISLTLLNDIDYLNQELSPYIPWAPSSERGFNMETTINVFRDGWSPGGYECTGSIFTDDMPEPEMDSLTSRGSGKE